MEKSNGDYYLKIKGQQRSKNYGAQNQLNACHRITHK